MNNFIPLITSNFFFLQGSPQLLRAAWISPNIPWISRHVLCNWKAVRDLILIIVIQWEKYRWSFPRATGYYWTGIFKAAKGQNVTSPCGIAKINAWGFTENSMAVLKCCRAINDETKSEEILTGLVLQHILQLFCWSSGGVLWADIFQHSWENIFFSSFR